MVWRRRQKLEGLLHVGRGKAAQTGRAWPVSRDEAGRLGVLIKEGVGDNLQLSAGFQDPHLSHRLPRYCAEEALDVS